MCTEAQLWLGVVQSEPCVAEQCVSSSASSPGGFCKLLSQVGTPPAETIHSCNAKVSQKMPVSDNIGFVCVVSIRCHIVSQKY